MSVPVAIVGVGGVFPGAPTLDRYWSVVDAAADTVGDPPPGRWAVDPERIHHPAPAPDRVTSRRACFVEEWACDGRGLDVEPALLASLDPAFHLLLSAGRDAWADAAASGVDRDRVGVVIGNIALPTDGASALADEVLGAALARRVTGDGGLAGVPSERLNRYAMGLPAGLLARALGLGGGALALDAACASSLFAVKLAADELAAGRADAMLAGGLSRPDSLYLHMGFSQLRALSPSGRAAPFDAGADGLVVGEGAGIVVLKRLADAAQDGDRIHAVIAGVGVSNDVGGSLLSPDSEGQVRAMEAAYRASGWRPGDVDLVECHGTGTPVGDATEFRSLRTLWRDEPRPAARCVIGSAKGNVGHLLTAAGAAGLCRVLLALRHRRLPPTANFRRPAPGVDLEGSPFEVLTAGRAWERRGPGMPRRAAVSAFGFGGTNAHLLLEEWLPDGSRDTANRPRRAAPPPPETPAVAVVGLGAHFGPWTDLDGFAARVLGESGDAAEPAALAPGWGDVADAGFHGWPVGRLEVPLERYRIPPAELAETLPQQLLMLEVAAAALADAGLEGDDGPRPRWGVFVGIGLDLNTTNFRLRWTLPDRARAWTRNVAPGAAPADREAWVRRLVEGAGPPLTANRTMGALGSIVASRVARVFRLGGPCFTLGSEETSGLRALETGVRALERGEVDVAVVGAVDLAADPRAALGHDDRRRLIRDGLPRPFDRDAHGSAVGEGAGALVLVRRADAVRDRRRIYAVVSGVGSATGGPAGGVVPSPSAYRRAVARAWREAGAEPAAAGYLEAHGSGDPDEDGMETTAAVPHFGSSGKHRCAVGSAKADVGHAGAAAGAASLVKAVLALHRRVVPPLRNLERPRAGLSTPDAGVDLPRAAHPWPGTPAAEPRRAGVSAFSVSGDCVHVVLAGHDDPAPVAPAVSPVASPAIPPVTSPAILRGPDSGATLNVLVGLARFTVPPPPAPGPADPGPPDSGPDPAPRIHRAVADPTPAAGGAASDAGDPMAALVAQAAVTAGERTRTEAAFQRFQANLARSLASALAVPAGREPAARAPEARPPAPTAPASRATAPATPDPAAPVAPDPDPSRSGGRALDREQCLEFATGSIGAVLGPAFAAVDTHPTRVRLPDEPLMLVDRVLDIRGEARSLGPGRVITEHEVRPGAWYLDGGRIPTALAVEAGQADLLLSAWLGVDFATRGEAVYRLLDAAVTYHAEPPAAPAIIRYDIRIERFFRQGDTHLFRFAFDATADGKPLLTMRDGCAGFFRPEELAAGRGIVAAGVERRTGPGTRPDDWRELAPPAPAGTLAGFDEAAVAALRAGDLAGCFGPAFADLGLARPAGLPGGRLALVHRVPVLEPGGGRHGLGRIVGEADVAPDDWYLTCHFVDDQVMPGTLMYEASLQTLRIFLLRLGFVAESDAAFFAPLPGVTSRLKCRGQVTRQTSRVRYEVEPKEIGYAGGDGAPYAIADAVMYADGRPVVEMSDMSLALGGAVRAEVEARWSRRPAAAGAAPPVASHGRILAFAMGRPSAAFGASYRPFDGERFVARLPRPPYNFLHRIVEVADCTAGRLAPGARARAEYDVPADGWYFAADGQAAMPLAVLLEVALQPCGWLAAYLGAALGSGSDLHFRNLDGEATRVAAVGPDAGTLATDVRLTDVSRSGEMIVLRYAFSVGTVEGEAYRGETVFGFFTPEMMGRQAGFPEAAPGDPPGAGGGAPFDYPAGPGFPDPRLRMVDRVTRLDPAGGPRGLGLVRGETVIDPARWYFDAHFQGDPVWPGSLGLEALLQLLRVLAAERWGAAGSRVETAVPGEIHRWSYRGQVVPADRVATVEAVVTEADEGRRLIRADGRLAVDGRVIYRMSDFTLRIPG